MIETYRLAQRTENGGNHDGMEAGRARLQVRASAPDWTRTEEVPEMRLADASGLSRDWWVELPQAHNVGVRSLSALGVGLADRSPLSSGLPRTFKVRGRPIVVYGLN